MFTKRKKIFFDCEFTGLHQNTTLISIAFVADCGRSFYAELTDYDVAQVDNFLQENVINKLTTKGMNINHNITTEYMDINDKSNDGNAPYTSYVGKVCQLKQELEVWFASFGEDLEMWSDCLAYDWVLFNNIFGTAFDIPKCIYYIPFDICTLFNLKNIDPDISREDFAGLTETPSSYKHNSLFDALVIRTCYERLVEGI